MVSRCALRPYAATHICSVFVVWSTDKKNRCEAYKKSRPCALSNILTVAFWVGLPVEMSNSVPASQVVLRFQLFRVIDRFCVEGRNKRSDHEAFIVMISTFSLTVLSERQNRHFRFFEN